MNRRTILVDPSKAPSSTSGVYLCEHCGLTTFTRDGFRRHMEYKHSDITSSYECSRCEKKYSRLDNLQRHMRSHRATAHSIKIVDYDLKEMSPERAARPRWKPYYQKPESKSSYLYQQTLRSTQTPMKWILEKIDDLPKSPRQMPTTLNENTWRIPLNPRCQLEDPRNSTRNIDYICDPADLEEMDRQLQAILEDYPSPRDPSSPVHEIQEDSTRDLEDLECHPENWITIDSLDGGETPPA